MVIKRIIITAKYTISFCFFLLISNLFAINKIDIIYDSILLMIENQNLSSDSRLYINLQIRENSDYNIFSLQQKLLQDSYTISDSEDFTDYTFSILLSESVLPKKKGGRLSKIELVKETIIMIQLVRSIDMQVIEIKRVEFEDKYDDQQEVEGKWYTPFLILFVLSSLVYLLFYGS